MNNELLNIIDVLENVYKCDINKYDHSFIKQVLEKRLKFLEFDKTSEYAFYLSNNLEEAISLFKSLNINHTEFFRNSLTFAHLEQWILPGLIESISDKSELRIWSAGCSSGQEAYSLAILIENINAKKLRKCRYRIIATDVSESILIKANSGEYTEKDLQKIRLMDLNEYFVKSKDGYVVCDKLKKNISFSKHDLLDDQSIFPKESIFGGFDLVVCSNLLFYYKPTYQQEIIDKLINSMNNQGYLVTGEVERQEVAKNKKLRLVIQPSPIFKKSEVRV